MTGLTPRVYLGCIDSVLNSQRTVQCSAAPTPLSQGEGEQLLQSHGMVTVEVHLRCHPVEDYSEHHR